MKKHVQLKNFTKQELMFDDEETKIILKFIFKDKVGVVDNIKINDRVRGFTQGLLVEAIDASYALGFVEALFKSAVNPGAGANKILSKFGKQAFKHWFKHATANDLMQIKIYETVRVQLALNFGRILTMYANGLAKNEINHSAFIAYADNDNSKGIWG